MLPGLFVLQVVIRATEQLDCCKAANDANACCQEVQVTGNEISTPMKNSILRINPFFKSFYSRP